jgi:hypothetical protein
MSLPTTGFDAHGHRCALEPKEVTIPAVTLKYVEQYTGYSYNTYVVQYLGEFWPTADAAATAIYGSTGWGAHWATNPAADGTRALTVHTD